MKETLEEAAEKYSNQFVDGKDHYYGFTEGANWQSHKMYSEEEVIGFSEWVSLNFPNQHNYLRNLQKRSQGLDVPVENLKGYYSTKELFEQYKNK